MRVHAIRTGSVQVKRTQVNGRGHGLGRRAAPLFDSQWSDWLPVFAFAIEHKDGIILVDTGSNARLMSLPRWHPYFRFAVHFDIDREQEIGPRLRAIGITPGDVKTIVLTHMHIDHDGGLADFPGARVLVAPGELRATAGVAGQIQGYLPQRWPSGFDPKPFDLSEGAFGAFHRSRRLTKDGAVIAVATPGHTADHISVIVDDGDAAIVIAGDASYTQANMLSGALDGVSGNETWASGSLAALRAFAASRPTVYLPTHDPGTPTRLANRETAVAGKFAA